jgi:hypothetical protein
MQSFYQFTTQKVFDQLKTSASGLTTEAVPALQKNMEPTFYRKQNKKPN